MEPEDRPPLRTFRPRRRRLSNESLAAYDRGLDRWSFSETGPPLDLVAEFGRSAPVVLEIGFGGGESLVELATSRPDLDIVGVEVHQPGIALVLRAIERSGLTNVRLVEGDALVVLPRFGAHAFHEIRVFFPDPWPKTKHVKRRIIRADVIGELTDRLVPGGRLHLATDWDDYVTHMLVTCAAEPRLAGGIVDRPAWRALTRFEQRGLDAGHTITDLAYERR